MRVSKGTESIVQPAVGPHPAPHQPALRNRVMWNDSMAAQLRELVAHRELLYRVIQREIKVRYKQTALGMLWAIVQPLSLMVVFAVLFSLIIGVRGGEVPYPLFFYSALLPWTFFSTAVSFAVPSLLSNGHLITKVFFPREIVPLASVFAALVDFAVASLVLVGMLAYYQVGLTWNVLFALPILAILVVLTTGLCLFLSALTVMYRDVRFTIPLLIQLLMFATPILYPASTVPERFRALYMLLNPLAAIVDGFRRAVIHGEQPELAYLASAGLVSLTVAWLSYRFFKHLERTFADII